MREDYTRWPQIHPNDARLQFLNLIDYRPHQLLELEKEFQHMIEFYELESALHKRAAVALKVVQLLKELQKE